MSKLTKDFIENYISTVHTYDSLGRVIVEAILNHSAIKAGNKGAKKIMGNLHFEVTANDFIQPDSADSKGGISNNKSKPSIKIIFNGSMDPLDVTMDPLPLLATFYVK